LAEKAGVLFIICLVAVSNFEAIFWLKTNCKEKRKSSDVYFIDKFDRVNIKNSERKNAL
jgi:hypothetical protein